MRCLKLLVFSLLVCGLCASQAPACSVGVGGDIAGYCDVALTKLIPAGHGGDGVYYVVDIFLSPTTCPISGGIVQLTLPNNTVVTLDTSLSLASGGEKTYPPVFYTVNTADIGSASTVMNPCPPGAVQAIATITAKGFNGTNYLTVAASFPWPIYVVEPNLCVTKIPEPNVACLPGTVHYDIDITNCSTLIDGSPLPASILPYPLDVNSITDSLLGNITDSNSKCSKLDLGDTCTIGFDYPIDPAKVVSGQLSNTVTVKYTDELCDVNTVTRTASANVTVIEPNFTVSKVCKIKPIPEGGPATFHVMIINTGTGDLDIKSIIDDPAASNVIPKTPFLLKTGDPCSFDITVNTVNPCEDVNNTITVTADANKADCGDIIRKANAKCFCIPVIDVNKVAECNLAAVIAGKGTTVTYKITITNKGTDPLNLVSVIDTLLGDITANADANSCNPLAGGASCSFTVPYKVKPTDPNTLENVVDVNYVDAQGNHATDSNTAIVKILHPNFTVTKTCTSNPIPSGGPATFDVNIVNTGDVTLVFTTDETTVPPGPFTVAAHKNAEATVSITTTGTTDVNNTVNVTANLVPASCLQLVPPPVKQASATCFGPPCITIKKVPDCNISMPGNGITYTITITNCGSDDLTVVDVNDTFNGVLQPDLSSKACSPLKAGVPCSFKVTYNVPNPFSGSTVNNTVSAVYENAEGQKASATATVPVTIVHPNFTVTKTCTSNPIPVGGPATFDVNIVNTGDVTLVFTTSETTVPAGPFTVAAGKNVEATVSITTPGTSDVTNTITVTANLVPASCLQLVPPPQKPATATCTGTPVGGATRTWGFWKEHTAMTECVFAKCGSSFNLGWRQVTTNNQLFGIFFANNAKNSDGSKRCALGQARVTASHQALAALLNTCLDNGKPLPAGMTLCTIANTLKCGTAAQVITLNGQLDTYNSSGDNVNFAKGECPQGNGSTKYPTPNIAFADTKGGSDCTNSTGCPTCP